MVPLSRKRLADMKAWGRAAALNQRNNFLQINVHETKERETTRIITPQGRD